MYVYLIPFLPPLNNPGQNPDLSIIDSNIIRNKCFYCPGVRTFSGFIFQ